MTIEQKKAARKASAERYHERKAARDKLTRDAAVELKEYLEKTGGFDKLSSNSRNFLLNITDKARRRVMTGKSVFMQMFGDDPRVGDTLTLKDIFDRTLKGKSTIDAQVKRWAERGIIIKCTENAEHPLETTYTLKAL